jgi:pyruvate formate lyase activating enzyme
MRIGGFQKVSLIDYPGKVATVVFTAGCNFRCPYCHNSDLVLHPDSLPTVPEEEIFAYLAKRKKLLDGVCITGGEPTLQKDLPEFAKGVKDLGLLVKLDTNGSQPSILQSMVKNDLVDYVALDIKAPLDERYERVSRCQSVNVSKIKESINFLVRLGIDFELRTTVVPILHSEKDLLDLAEQLSEIAPRAKWVLQNFRSKNCLDPEFEKIKPYDNISLEDIIKKLKVYMPKVELR